MELGSVKKLREIGLKRLMDKRDMLFKNEHSVQLEPGLLHQPGHAAGFAAKEGSRGIGRRALQRVALCQQCS